MFKQKHTKGSTAIKSKDPSRILPATRGLSCRSRTLTWTAVCAGILALTTAGADAATIPLSEEAGAKLDIVEVFKSAPIIYSILLLMSVGAATIWAYSIWTLRLNEMMPDQFINTVRQQLSERHYENAIETCQHEGGFAAAILASGISARDHGQQAVIETMQSEGRRAGNGIWQRISILNEIAVIAPMLGLLGTVVGLFFAFYDTTNASDNIVSIFDGLGIAIGTTVVGLVVAIMAMVFHTTLKYRAVNILDSIENESLALATLIVSKPQQK